MEKNKDGILSGLGTLEHTFMVSVERKTLLNIAITVCFLIVFYYIAKGIYNLIK